MTIFDTEEKNLREQIAFLETENDALKAHIIELERDNKALLDNCMKMQEQRLEDGRVIAALKLEREQLIDNIEEICFETNIDSSDFLPERKDED